MSGLLSESHDATDAWERFLSPTAKQRLAAYWMPLVKAQISCQMRSGPNTDFLQRGMEDRCCFRRAVRVGCPMSAGKAKTRIWKA